MALTAKEIALRLTPWRGSNKPRMIDAQPAIERVHHWTREGLLEPIGEKNPGRGRIRLYNDDAIFTASVLNELADFGVSVAVMRVALPHIRNARTYDENEGTVDFLCIQHGPALGNGSVYLHRQPSGPVQVDFGKEQEKVLWDDRPELLTFATSALFVNLSRLLTIVKFTIDPP